MFFSFLANGANRLRLLLLALSKLNALDILLLFCINYDNPDVSFRRFRLSLWDHLTNLSFPRKICKRRAFVIIMWLLVTDTAVVLDCQYAIYRTLNITAVMVGTKALNQQLTVWLLFSVISLVLFLNSVSLWSVILSKMLTIVLQKLWNDFNTIFPLIFIWTANQWEHELQSRKLHLKRYCIKYQNTPQLTVIISHIPWLWKIIMAAIKFCLNRTDR